MEKKKLIAEGKLDKYGRINDNTPESWKTSFVDLSVVGTKNDSSVSPIATTTLPANLVSTTPAKSVEASAPVLELVKKETSKAIKVC